ncbi:S-adenosyl-L-methionine-dependent methyltransferase [Infundibulicybe gibba]|nr:S-adenosyl-L-methionine-dependent methyltransferase [Infundibulicybe gibba]
MSTAPTTKNPTNSRIHGIIKEDDVGTWDQAWRENVTPWDIGQCQPPLREVVESGEVPFPHQGRALVPGCGKAYDVIYLANALSLDTLGIDVSHTAVECAYSILTGPDAPTAGKVTVQAQDFFSFRVPDERKFDVVYDYSFFVAIPVARRADWAKQMIALIKPGGYLITLVYPINPLIKTGPPFPVRPEYYDILLAADFSKVYDKVPTTSIQLHVGKERMVVWKRNE